MHLDLICLDSEPGQFCFHVEELIFKLLIFLLLVLDNLGALITALSQRILEHLGLLCGLHADLLKAIIEALKQAQLVQNIVLDLKIVRLDAPDSLPELTNLDQEHLTNLHRVVDQIWVLLQLFIESRHVGRGVLRQWTLCLLGRAQFASCTDCTRPSREAQTALLRRVCRLQCRGATWAAVLIRSRAKPASSCGALQCCDPLGARALRSATDSSG